MSRAKVIQAQAIMQEAEVVVYERQGPRAALHIMDSHSLEAVFLIARDFTLRGVLTKDRAMETGRRGTKVAGRRGGRSGNDYDP